eukprot:SAG22_NODE_9785_length_569_cov_1.708511_1_plen_55_part_10
MGEAPPTCTKLVKISLISALPSIATTVHSVLVLYGVPSYCMPLRSRSTVCRRTLH